MSTMAGIHPLFAMGVVVDGPTPKHAQLREILRRLVENELPPGAAIPSERELAKRHKVSRLTVRSAIGQLVDEGLLVRVRGKGTFTVRHRMDLRLYLMSFTDDMRRRGLVPTTEVLATGTEHPPAEVAEALRIGSGAKAHRLSRLRKANDVPLAVERGWYHAGLLPWLFDLDLTQSLYAQLATVHDIRFDHAKQTVWAEAADRETARLLGIRQGAPLLVFRRISSLRGEPVEDMTSWYRGDHYQVTTGVDPDEPGNPHNRNTATNTGGTR